jgi:hypothetical protein
VRLSVLDDASTSPERQFEKIETYARLGGHELVPITEADYDLDVSGSVSPFARPGIGPWLRDDRLDMWDAIVVTKLDRLTRSSLRLRDARDKEIQLGALAGEDVSERQATLPRAQEELARLHSLKPVEARAEHGAAGQTFRQRWEALDARGRNEFLRTQGVRADVRRDQIPPAGFSPRPVLQRSMAVIDKPGMKCVVCFGNLGTLLRPATDM